MKKIVFCGASSVKNINNFGDELLRDLYMKWAKDVCPGLATDFLVYDGLLSKKDNWRTAIASSDALVFNGGGYFGEKPFLKDSGLKKYIKKLAWGFRNDDLYGAAFKIAEKNAIPVIISGVEVGPISNPFFKSRVAKAIKYSTYCCVRNEQSHNYAVNISGAVKEVKLAIDSAMGIDREMVDELYPDALPKRIRKESNGFNIGLHIHELNAERGAAYFKKVVEKVAAMLPNDVSINAFILHDQRKNGVHPARSEKAEKALLDTFGDATVVNYVEPGQLLKDVAELDLVITTKLHLGIVSRALSVPVLSFPSHIIKTKRFYGYIGEDDFCFASTENVIDNFPERLAGILRDGGRVNMPVKSHVKMSAKAAEKNYKSAIEEVVK